MVDYIEGYLNLKRLVSDLHERMLKDDFVGGRAICDQIVVEARLTKAQIGAQDKAAAGEGK